MHARLADRRVNPINLRREFFYATPSDARDLLLELAGDLLQFEELPEALECHQSTSEASSPASSTRSEALAGVEHQRSLRVRHTSREERHVGGAPFRRV